jgi:glucose/arabinose dehydrogenase
MTRPCLPILLTLTALLPTPLLPTSSAAAETVRTETVTIDVTPVVGGLENPWAIQVLPDGAFIVTERPGRLRIVRDGKLSAPVAGLPEIAAEGQGGLLDVALSPNFARDRMVFLTAALPGDGGSGTGVIRGRLSDDEKSLEQVTVIFRMAKGGRTGRHFGSRIAFAADGTLFVSIGERGEMERAQDTKDHAGSILRITEDGGVPADNPFADGVRALPEIYSKGHRNPQGVVLDPLTGRLITVEHGAMGGDEVNMPEPGRNYGWPVITYGVNYNGDTIGRGTTADGFEQPVFYWDPSIAPGALAVYRGAMFPEWQDDLIVTSLKFGQLSRLDRDGAGKILREERFLDAEFGRLRDVVVAPDGALLVLTDEADGQILRMSRAAP